MTAVKKFGTEIEPIALAPATSEGIISQPIEVAPFGKIIEANFLGNGPKACSYDCPYCDLGRTFMRLNRVKADIPFPTPDLVAEAALAALTKIHTSGPSIDGILVAGNGEPTLHPDFPEVFKALVAARDLWLPGKPIHLQTNGAHLDQRRIVDVLNSSKDVHTIVKLDAGNEKTFKEVNAPLSRSTVSRILAGADKLKSVKIQAMFFKGVISNISNAEIDEWIEVIAIVKPASVHIQGLSRTPAESGLVRCEEDELYSIASKLERKTQIKAIVIP
jgi:wyosine [tRNA(Phe)-imidazoG37] synthetase (radical SAM superfamily)